MVADRRITEHYFIDVKATKNEENGNNLYKEGT